MMVLVAYDVNVKSKDGEKRLRHVAKTCENFGQRVQNSLFECLVEPAQWVDLRQRLISQIDNKKDSLRFYFLGKNWKRRVEHVGAKVAYDPEGSLVI
ncbi:CRISPR-associated endonuclease Cas2 [Aminobacterium mobile]|jgi:CRISPR-associated protein Cas2|uniref:CRISPR-associated endonuclease Cas2 n=1 Tax=Aminobacterium mobile TaxID=81467 RepID=UPI0033148AD0